MKKKYKKYGFFFRFFLSITLLIALVSEPALAIVVDDISDGATESVASYMEKRYHLNLRSLQDQGENFNVSSQKGRSPEVLLYFSPSDPKPGMDVEARAFPQFFGNQTDTVYFTWYLKRKGCGLDNGPVSEEKRRLCDRNDDKKITVEDWKIEAMQIIAARNFDSTCSLDGSLSEEERLLCAKNMYDETAPSRIEPSKFKLSDKDKDGYVASIGGDGRSEIPSTCTNSGSSSSTEEPEDDGFVPTATSGYGLTLSKDGGTGSSTLTISPTETLYEKTSGFDDTTEFCNEESGENKCTGTRNWRMASVYFSSGDSMVYSGTEWTRTITPVTNVFEAGKIYHLWWRDSPDSAIASAKLIVSNDSSGGGGGGSCSSKGSVCYIHDFGDGYNYELPTCRHLFPGNYKIDEKGRVVRDGDIAGTDDRGFPIEQEHFWRTDPEDPSTAKNGIKDEANLAGLGQDVFRWTYAPGDLVGVAVEGASMYSTKYDNSTPMVMWALPKNKCPVTGKSSKTETIKGQSVIIKTSTTDINKCLEDNLVDPAEGGQAENLNLSLSYAPDEPSAKLLSRDDPDSAAHTGDILTIRSASSNASRGSSYTNYEWRVHASEDGTFNARFGEENTWADITNALRDARNVGLTSGNNIATLSINLNLNRDAFRDSETKKDIPGFGRYFKDGIAYFRISTSATENFNGKAVQSGVASVIVKVVANKSIDLFGVDAVTNPDTKLVSVKRNNTRFCKDNAFQQSICPVLNHQIIGVNLDSTGNEIRDYSWMINDQPLVCSKRVSEECSNERQGPVNFFPVSGNVGDLFTLSVSASNSQTGESHTVSRRFQIVSPDFDFVSDDMSVAWPKYLGKYVNLDGSESEDYSKTSFEGIPGGIAKFSATFRPESLGAFILSGIKAGDDQNEMVWSINGKPFKWNDTSLSLALDGAVGDIYTVTLAGAYNQPRELRKALYDIWRISPFTSETLRFSKEIQIRLVLPEGSPYAKGKSNTFFASLISAVPPLVLFSVRLILSMGLILLIVGVAFAAMPEEKRG